MPTQTAQPIINQIVDHLSLHPGVTALILVGSQVEGNAFPPDQYSDIELYVIAKDEEKENVEKAVQNIQSIFSKDVVLAYQNQWAGWSILLSNLLRVELPITLVSNLQSFVRSDQQKYQILYAQPDFQLPARQTNDQKDQRDISKAVKDFWYMAVYTAQHIARGELFLARGAMRISMQGKVKRLIEDLYHPEKAQLEEDRRIELTWTSKELDILKQTSCAYDKADIIRAFWANIRFASQLLNEAKIDHELFNHYESELKPKLQAILK